MDHEWVVDTWLASDGMPESSVTSTVADAEGYRWVGTLLGLARFGGQEFVPEPVPPRLHTWPRSYVNMWRDRADRLWMSDDQGIVRRERDVWVPWTPTNLWNHPPGVARVVRSFAETEAGHHYLSTLGGQVFEVRQGAALELPPPVAKAASPLGASGAPAEVILVLDADQTPVVLAAGRLLRWQNGRWHELARTASSRPGLGAARAGGFWWLDGTNLERWERGRVVARQELTRPITEPWSLHELSDGELWVTSTGHGLFRIQRGGHVLHYGPDDLLLGASPRIVSEDDEGTRWVGTLGGGLSRFRRRAIHAFESDQGLAPSDVKSVAVGQGGQVIAGAWESGVSALGAGEPSRFSPRPTPGAPGSPFSVLVDRAGRVWVGYSGGALWHDTPNGWRPVWADALVGRDVRALFEDRVGAIWAGGPRGLARVAEGNPTGAGDRRAGAPPEVREFPLELDSSVIAITEEPVTGEIWMATAQMVFRGGAAGFRRELALEELAGGGIASLRGDPAGGLWVGTVGQGLVYWRNERGRPVKASGFTPEAIWGMEFDSRTNLWLTSPQGVLWLDRATLWSSVSRTDADADAASGEATGTAIGPRLIWQRLAREEGLTCGACMSYSQPTMARGPDGRIWIAAVRGVAVVDPLAAGRLQVPPRIRFDRLIYDRVEIGGGRAVSHAVPLRGAGEVRLPPGSRRVEIRYDVLSLSAPERVRTEVKLEGVDQDWVDNSGWRLTHYTDPPPGRYRFRARACNSDGVWNEEGVELRFVIEPYYWQTGWFRWGAAVAAVAGTAGLTGWLNRRRWLRQLELNHVRQRLAHVLESTNEGVVFLTPQGRVLYWNHAAAEIMGRIPDAGPSTSVRAPAGPDADAQTDGEGWDYFALFGAESGERLRKTALPALARDGSWEGEAVLPRPDGSRRWLEQSWMAHRDAAGRPEFISSLLRDVTDRHRAEEALRELNASLERRVGERTAELAASNEKLQELDRLKSEFLAMMSHELRTPLNSIIGFTGILKAGLAGEVNAEQTKQLGMVNRSAKHLLNLINDLLDLSRIEAGRMEVHREPVLVGEILEEVERTLSPLATAKGLVLRREVDDPSRVLATDRRKVFQVVLNLAGNAVKFTEQGEVVIAAGVRDGSWEVAVRDTGPGVKPENMACLFEAFRQVDGSARRNREGAGLGLYLCRKLAGLLHGDIQAESEFGRGSTFRFRLPLA